MANEAGEQELLHATENTGEEDEDHGKEKGTGRNNQNGEEIGRKYNEDSVRQTSDGNTDINTAADSNVVVEGMDTQGNMAPETSDKLMLEFIDEPPDGFFDDLLKDDFLDSLAVVDMWNPDADDSCGSDAGGKKLHKDGRETDDNKRQTALEDTKIKYTEVSADKSTEGRSRRDSDGHRRKGEHTSQSSSKRHVRTSVETKIKSSRDRSTERKVCRRDKGGSGDRLHSIENVRQKGCKRMRERSRERKEDREKVDRNSKQRNIYRRERGSRENSSERNIHTRGRGDKEKNMETNISTNERVKSTERLVQKEDRSRNIDRVSRRYSYQYRVSNKVSTADVSAKRKKCGLRLGVSDVGVEGDVSSESIRKGKNSDTDVANRETQIESIHKEHNLEKEMSQGIPGMVRHGAENRVISEVAGSQSHAITNLNNPPLNSTKLDTCIKELDDLVPPGTEDSFILYARDEAADVNEFEAEGNKDAMSHTMLRSEKSSKHLIVGTESANKEIYVISRKIDEHKILDNVESEKVSSCTARLDVHKRTERINYPHERKRRRSESNRSEGRRHASSESKRKHDYLYEERKGRHQKSSCGEKKINSSSLERVCKESRMKNEVFNEQIKNKREYSLRSQSREKWQCHSDLHRLKRRGDDQNDPRRSRSGSRDKKHELSVRQERMGRSRSRDRQYRKIENVIRRSHSGIRDKQLKLSLEQERSGEKQHRRASSEDRCQSDVAARTLRGKKDVQNYSRRLVRSVSRDRQHKSSLPARMSRSHSRDRQLRTASSKYRDRQGRYRRSGSRARERRRRSLSKSRLSPSCDKFKQRAPNLSPVSVGQMSSSHSLSFDLSLISSDRERWRSSSRSLSRERRSREYRRSYPGSSFSPVSSGSTFSRSGSFVSLSSLSDEKRQRRRKRSPFWKEMERKFATDLCRNVYDQSTAYAFPSSAGTALPECYNPSSHPSTYSSAAAFHPVDPTAYSHSYPPGPGPGPGFSPAVIQPPPPDNNIVPPSFGSAPPHHLEQPSVPPVMPPTPVAPPVYFVPPPITASPVPMGFTGQPVPFTFSSEFSSSKDVFHQSLFSSEEPQHPTVVPPPPKISQSGDGKKVSLSSLLEASAKAGGSTKKKQMSVDPLLVVRCEEAINTLQADGGVTLFPSGHLVLQESPGPYTSTASVSQTFLQGINTFRSPILRTPDLHLSFTSSTVCDNTSEQSYCLPKMDLATSAEGHSQISGEPHDPHAVTSSFAPVFTEYLKSYVDSSSMTDISGDVKKVSEKPENCLSCLEYKNRIMVWNSTQTEPIVKTGDKITDWNSTQIPCVSVESVGIQAQICRLRPLCKWAPRNKESRKVHVAREDDDVKSGSAKEAVNRRSSASHSNASRTSHWRSDTTPTAALREDKNKEASSESKYQSPKPTCSSASSANKSSYSGDGTYYKTSTYQAYGTGPPKGILKNSSQVTPSPSSQTQWQQSSFQKNCDVPGYSVTSKPGSVREYGNTPVLFATRSSSSFGGMGTSSAEQSPASGTGPAMFHSAAACVPKFGNPGVRSTLDRDENFYDMHRSQPPCLLRGSGNAGAGLSMPPFQQQSSVAFRQTGNPSMNPYNAGPHY
ncbi:uncharacterized protein LOC110826709 isoform X2 [Zootermopsis nevadensis]|uniref:uncharacterized protein LOC110826709 isoform X2 n=1 Tax=Zootermopsis nevadensis TaxID=136037 RepID=UPI000B8EB522|nr:uncharacterized protein LOC110826709 isoform X2 [Zootermopsis nevadensis]